MDLVSRDRGREILTELVGALDQLESVPTISQIYINPNFDSVLEARFIESLKRMGGVAGIPKVKLVQDIINGKSGHVLEIAGQRYKVEPQRNVGPSDGVMVASKPDFVIWPWQSGTSRKPIAVFCDGWQFHQNSLREDANKRSALVLRGRFWVWSVTNDDVKTALDGNAHTDLDSPLAALSRHDGGQAPAAVLRALPGAFGSHAIAQLLAFLSTSPGVGTQDAAVLIAQRNVLWLNFLMVPNTPAERTVVESRMSTLLAQLPVDMQGPKAGFAPVLSKSSVSPTVLSWWPMNYASGIRDGMTGPGVVLLEDLDSSDENVLRLNWRKWLALFNQEQMLQGMLLATRSAMDEGDCAGWLPPLAADAVAGASSPSQQMLAKEWDDVVEQTLQPLRSGLLQLAGWNAPLPLIGYELADDRGHVVAEAEMAWPDQRLVVLTADQDDLSAGWMKAGWDVFQLSDDYLTVSDAPWASAVALKLNLEISVAKENYES
jgi:DEAD/DEAH box helicase domain-containing protein